MKTPRSRKKLSDFRSKRTKLPARSFALSTGRDHHPRDLIKPKVWRSITALPDDVSIRTSNDFGSPLALAWNYWGEWISVIDALQGVTPKGENSPLADAALTVGDDLQVSVYNALTGFYRAATGSLRSVVEQMTVGAYLELSRDQANLTKWQSQTESFGFGNAANLLVQIPSIADIERELKQATNDNLFHQKNGSDPGGLARRIFGVLNRYVHTQPGFTDGDIWDSNGPVYVPKAFVDWIRRFVLVYAYALLVSRLAQPKLIGLGHGSKYTAQSLFVEAVQLLPKNADSRLLSSVPARTWQ